MKLLALLSALVFGFTSIIVLEFIPGKGYILLWVNNHHSLALDYFFTYFSIIGNGFTFLVLVVFFLFVRFKYSIIIAAAGLLHSLFILLLKNFFFKGLARPKNCLENFEALHTPEWVVIYGQKTFPSGHATTAFAAALILFLIFKGNKALGITFFLLAALIAYSRVYLLQHFMVDVFAGMSLGLFTSSLVWIIFKGLKLPDWANKRLNVNIKVLVTEHPETSVSNVQ